MNFKFTDAATNAINEASRIEANFGKDFTLRIRFKVNNVANTDNINDVMSNKATSKFHYTQLGNETYDADSNAVQIKVKDALVKLDFIKQDEAGQPLAGAIFGLFKDGKQIGDNITSDKDGKFSFSGKTSELPDGTYILKEITPPSGYDPVGEIKVFVKNGQIDYTDNGKELTDPDQDGVVHITDKRSPYELQLKKVGTDGKVLAGAEFILTDDKGNQIPGATKITSGEDGLISFGKDFDWTKTYYFKETKAPAGHKLDNSVYKVTFDQAKGQATLTNLTTEKATTVTITKDGIAQFTITNDFKDLSLRIKKIDSETNELLAGAEFTLTGPDGKTTVVTSKNVDGQDWNIEFKNLKPGTYTLKETKAPDGYELDNTEHKIVIGQDGSVTYDGKKLDQITNDSNMIIVGTPEIGNSPQKVMPHTGGSGIGSLMMFASILLGLATILLVITYVKRQEVRDHD